ncbi:MAG: hypothetical protein O9345_15145 [Burkholderiaceae bacterium]|jgi:hypothetical protein|nr:hypothetical protein [Burkholderiales bacterium]MCZ8108724.1 hypothetical protein [Burkholderiales bacterium]MCZ8339460.1 hypothetical protein [Burkholderiaceae bacterium]
MKQPSERPDQESMTERTEDGPVRVSMGTGVILPHVERHLRRTLPKDPPVRMTDPAARVSMGTGFRLPAIAAHVRRSDRNAR